MPTKRKTKNPIKKLTPAAQRVVEEMADTGYTKWEYHLYQGTNSLAMELGLNTLGNDGWELVAIRSMGTGRVIHYLKRQKK